MSSGLQRKYTRDAAWAAMRGGGDPFLTSAYNGAV